MRITDSFEHDEVLGLKFGYHPFSRPKLNVHVYHADGLLIDTGQSRMSKEILEATKDLPVEQIFVTHHHEDHSANIQALREQHHCEAYASPACCEMMLDPPAISLAQKLTWGDRPAYDGLRPIEGRLNTKNFSFELIPIPGHARDMVALYEAERKWLFSADLYINSRIEYMLKSESVALQIASIEKILHLDFEQMFCAHKPQLTNPKEKLKQKLDGFRELFRNVQEEYRKGYKRSEIMRNLNLKEDLVIKWMSGGKLSRSNMVNALIRDIKAGHEI